VGTGGKCLLKKEKNKGSYWDGIGTPLGSEGQ